MGRNRMLATTDHPVRNKSTETLARTSVDEISQNTPAARYRRNLVGYFNSVAGHYADCRHRFLYYKRNLASYLRFLIPPEKSVVEIGCGNGDLLNELRPSRGVGLDLSRPMVDIASDRHPHLEFSVDDLENLQRDESFDYVVMTDLVGYLYDVQAAFSKLHGLCHENTRIILVYFNHLWAPALKLAEWLGLRMSRPPMHWLPMDDIENLLRLNGFEAVKKNHHTLIPIGIPLVANFCNRVLAHLPFFRKLCLNQVVVARPLPTSREPDSYSCSIVVPCRNEKGNIREAVRRIPLMGCATEIIFVEGGSKDDTLSECYRVRDAHPELDIKVVAQDGKGKGDAVRKGFSVAEGDVLMILDADLTVPPEDLPKFYDAIASGKGEFINGTRLVYAMERDAMRYLNIMGNKFFSVALSWLLNQSLKDTLCGTKVLLRTDYERIAAGRHYFGDFDPFGDFDLIFGAAKLNLKIVEVPIRYRDRTYGSTNISRFYHGWLLLKMTLFALRKIKLA